MSKVFKSKQTGEYGILGDDGRFSWVTPKEAREALEATEPFYCEDGAEIGNYDPIWEDMVQLQNPDEVTL
jgi:hypothetical protein